MKDPGVNHQTGGAVGVGVPWLGTGLPCGGPFAAGQAGQAEHTCDHDFHLPQGGVSWVREEEVHISCHAALFGGSGLGLPLLGVQHDEGAL